MTPPPRRTRSRAVVALLRDAARIDRSQSDPVVALRNAVGVAAPLAIGVLLGSATIGLPSTIGALQTAFADRPGPYRLRVVRMVGTATVAAITSGLAVLASTSDVGSAALLLVLGFGAGLLLGAGPSATQVGTAAVATALVLGHLPQPPSVAVHVGLLVLLGGVGQTVLAVLGWPLGRHRPERLALAALYRELARAARVPAGTSEPPPTGDVLTATRQTLYGLGHDHGPSVEAYRVLLDEGERIRRETVVIAAAAERLADDRNPILAGFVREASTASAAVLDEIADALVAGREVTDRVLDRARATIRFAITRLENDDAPGEPTRRAAASRLRALSGQLRAAVDSTRTGAGEGRSGQQGRRGVSLRTRIAELRYALTPSPAVRLHAVRVAVLVAGSDLVTRLAGFERGYWVSLTVLVVLRPDFGSTLQRSTMRVAGTVVGLLIASELVHWIPGGQWWNVALILIFAFGMRFAGPTNVAPSAISLSALVVVLLAVDGVAPHETLVDRSVATLIGGALAVLAALLLPAWERQFLPGRMAALLRAYRDYLAALADPQADRAALGARRTAARMARTEAQASVDRAEAEPVPARSAIELGRSVLANSHRIVHAELTYDALRGGIAESGGVPELKAFLDDAVRALDITQAAVAAGRAPGSVPRLRRRYDALVEAVDTSPDRVGGPEAATTLEEATDRITDGIDTLVSTLRRELSVPDDEVALPSDA
ncbi:FUSC family protein [Jatrophihabitans endophyticus]|uniref:FUSC family protein n=1 Tax=Jatrophihabitans endophyticus TaxID=1206085 RepID=UPI0019FB6679|nr:FUSC family protein [Jatrophihabitans endophyticus]MBE7189156.1 FUSC family protein [Jatrophihabitans endophyticus]